MAADQQRIKDKLARNFRAGLGDMMKVELRYKGDTLLTIKSKKKPQQET